MNLPLVSASRTLASKDAALRLCGPLDANLRTAEHTYGVQTALQGLLLTITGDRAQEALRYLVDQEVQALKHATPEGPSREPKGPAVPRTPGQEALAKALQDNILVLAEGPAGSGKTRLPVDAAVAWLKEGKVDRIILTRPAIEAGERLGFLPGDMKEKVDPFMQPLYDALSYHYTAKVLASLLAERVIEIAPVAFMRGRTLQRAAIVVDEAQNLTVGQTKMILTRIGQGSRMAMVGDARQVDLPRGTESGLVDAITRLCDTQGVGVVRLTKADCVRSPIVARILDAYGD